MRYRARVEYDGTGYGGFQLQQSGRTVQGELEAALRQLNGGVRVRVEVAGRTDAGVHAAGQVVAFTYGGPLSAERISRSLDAMLPRDVAMGRLHMVSQGFHPRTAARSREYRYTIWNGPRSPLRERYALGVREPLDTAAMATAGTVLLGRHDFSAFGGWHRQPIRTLFGMRVRRSGHTVTIDVAGDAFLRQMVRSIAAALVGVGLGEMTSSDVALALRSPGRAFDGAVAPPHGLSLRRVRFTSAGRQGSE